MDCGAADAGSGLFHSGSGDSTNAGAFRFVKLPDGVWRSIHYFHFGCGHIDFQFEST